MILSPEEKAIWLEGMKAGAQRTAIEALGITFEAVDDESVTLQMPITDRARQPFGLLHGGVSMVLAETAASTHACYGVDLTQMIPVGIEINGSHLRSASDGTVRAIARVIRRSRTMIVHQIDIYHIETDKQLCTARVTNYYKPLHAEQTEQATSDRRQARDGN